MHIQIVNFNLKDMTVSEYEELCNEIAGAFAQVPGLLSKVWLADREANTFGGIYTWRDEQALRAIPGDGTVSERHPEPALRQHHGARVQRPGGADARDQRGTRRVRGVTTSRVGRTLDSSPPLAPVMMISYPARTSSDGGRRGRLPPRRVPDTVRREATPRPVLSLRAR